MYLKFIYFWQHWVFVAAHGLSLVAARWSSFLVAMHRFLTEVAFLVVEHGLSSCGTQILLLHRI